MDPALGDRVLIFFGIVLKQDGEKPEGSDRDHDEAAEHANQKHCAKSVDEPVGHCRHLPKPSYSIAVSHHRSFWVSEMPETETQGPVLWVFQGSEIVLYQWVHGLIGNSGETQRALIDRGRRWIDNRPQEAVALHRWKEEIGGGSSRPKGEWL